MRMNMELGNAVFLTNHLDTDEWASSKPAKLVYDPSYDARTPAHRPVLNLEATPPPSEYIPSTFTRDQLQREVILAIHANKPTSEILHLLRDASIPLPEDTDPSTLPYPNPNMILDARQHTALHWAATFARTQLVETLLSYHANPCAMNLNLETPLMRASCSRSAYDAQNYDTLLTLLAPISARQKDQAGQTVLHKIAVSASNNAGDQIAQTYYMKCIVEWIDDGGFLSWLNPKDTVSSLGADVYKSKVKSVVAGFVNARDERGDTALHVAVRGRCVGIVRLLVKLGASTELWNEEGEKPGDLCDEDDSVMIEALRFWSLAGGRRNRGRYQPEEEYPLDQFEQQIEACQLEITNLHRSQTRLERLHQSSLDLAKKFKQTAFRPIIKPTISLERFSTSPATSVTCPYMNRIQLLHHQRNFPPFNFLQQPLQQLTEGHQPQTVTMRAPHP
ncbi:ankyrin [Rhizoclosmatium globosum]|uniref:Ankyrin n=1 Tax=Rhizoclosmatium globosum TaxID=329046 RepID=A0A1Y2CDW6_9FUNG|nr:ankyrin [Rhizoclosmatium globosum]|eukprot:ORY45258.1 ankyrin [Rhizoclosmatium globosum]